MQIFSKVGIGARSVELVLRRRALTLYQAMRWRGQHLFLSEITEPERGWLSVKAAAVVPVMCKGREDGKTFPGVLTEKYLRHEQLEPMAAVTSVYVLVTPKVIELKRGGMVAIGGEAYQVLVCHALDTFKNEYEIKNVKEL